MMTTSAACLRATSIGSWARRIDSSAAMGTSTRRRTAASSSTVRQGCSTYSMGTDPAALAIAGIAAHASSTSHAPLASTRIFAWDPTVARRASATAEILAQSRPTLTPGSATLIFAVAHPPEAMTRSWASSGETTGIVTLTGTNFLRETGGNRRADSSQREDSASS